jgi:hypothetical protein
MSKPLLIAAASASQQLNLHLILLYLPVSVQVASPMPIFAVLANGSFQLIPATKLASMSAPIKPNASSVSLTSRILLNTRK